MITTLMESIREYKKASLLSPFFVTLEVLLECLMPFRVATLVTQIENGASMQEIINSGLILVLMAFFALVFGALAGRFAAQGATGFAKNLRKDMFYNIQNFSFENIGKFSSSSLVTRLTTDITNVQMAFMMIIRAAIRTPIMFIFSFFMAYYMGGKMAIIFLVIAPILAIALALIMAKVMPIFKRVFKKYDNLNTSVQENIKGMRVVKAYVREEFERQKFAKATKELKDEFTLAERIIAINSPVFQFCINAVFVFILAYGGYTIITSAGNDLRVGELSALLTYSFQILYSLMMFSMVFVMITLSEESARRIKEVLDEDSTLENPENPIYEVKDGSIEFENVSFSYNEDRTDGLHDLTDINLKIESGETIGIIGSTGSSKSTLVQLIPRLYNVTEGVLKVGGVNVNDYDLTTLRDQVAVVLQKNILFSGTIKDNLRWGNKDASDEDLIEACKLAQAHDFIMEFPEGYDTYIEQGGSNVSGGQKQRICIARALLKKPKVLIMDDSTSAVDTKTDAMIREGLRNYIPETTQIIIAQRTASVEDADRIIVMNAGRIESIANHEELLESSEVYNEVYTSQSRQGGLDE